LEKDEKKTWNDIAHKEQITDDNKSDDPSASLMNMMKKIYQEGDEETKKTIAKAWTETQSRQFKNT
jgi:calcyclin binding protein